MRRIVSVGLLLVLAGCGVEGPPEPVETAAPRVTVSGTASVGVTGSF